MILFGNNLANASGNDPRGILIVLALRKTKGAGWRFALDKIRNPQSAIRNALRDSVPWTVVER